MINSRGPLELEEAGVGPLKLEEAGVGPLELEEAGVRSRPTGTGRSGRDGRWCRMKWWRFSKNIVGID